MKKIVIIGGGITGLSTAWKLAENGKEVIIIESSDSVGGLARSVKVDNYYFDIGPHSFFSEDKEVFNAVMDLFRGEAGEIPFSRRSVKMWFRDRYVDYPLSAKSVLLQMGLISPILSSLSFAKSYLLSLFVKPKDKERLTIEEWAIGNFGKYLFLNFFKPYTEQFWKIPTSELSHRVIPSSKKMDFAKTLKHLLISKYLEISKREPGKLSLVQRESLPSYYPKKGFGEIAKRISNIVTTKGGKILLNETVEEIKINNDKSFEIKTNKGLINCECVVSTIPINKLVPKILPKPSMEILDQSSKLQYLSLILVYLITKRKNVLNCQYCYYINKPYNRISEMNAFSDNTSPEDKNILSVEISCLPNSDLLSMKDSDLYDRCMTSIEKDKIISKDEIIDYKVLKVSNVYPIYRKDYEKSLNETNKFFSGISNFFSIGRQGQFYYGDIDQMIRIGFDKAKKIISDN